MAMRIKRSAAEMIAELQAKMDRIRAEASDERIDPAVQFVTERMVAYRSPRNEMAKVLSDIPQFSADHRILGHQLWIEKIEAEKELALAHQAYADKAEPRYSTLYGTVEKMITDGLSSEKAMEYAETEHNKLILELQPESDRISRAQMELSRASKARKDFSEKKKRGDRDKSQKDISEENDYDSDES